MFLGRLTALAAVHGQIAANGQALQDESAITMTCTAL